MTSLPIFSTYARPAVDVDVDRLTNSVLGGRDTTIKTRGGQTSVRGPDHVADIDAGRGGVWAGDISRLWRDPEVRAPESAAVGKIAEAALSETGIVPRIGEGFRLADGIVRYSQLLTEKDGERSATRAEAVYSRSVVVDADVPGEKGRGLPLFGGGGKFSATVGTEGQVLALSGTWRHAELVDKRDAFAPEAALEAAGLRNSETYRVHKTRLGYYSAPPFVGQSLMFPVYAVYADVRAGDRWIPARVRLIPATDIGVIAKPETYRARRSRNRDLAPSNLAAAIVRGETIPAGLTVNAAALQKQKLQLSDVVSRGPRGLWVVHPLLSDELIKALLEAIRPRAFGTSWIGEWGGLGGSQGNAQGFVDEMTAEGWQERFNWGNQDAWKSDWVTSDDDYVDDVDFVFYTGHAGPDGWQLATGGEADWLSSSDVGTSPNVPSDLWGQENLEWVIIAACGPLQDDVINGGGNVFDRWRAAFDGLHLMMGYSAITFDNEEEGRRIASYARSGMTLMQSWFRTAEEIQPSTNDAEDPYGPDVFAATMYIGDSRGHTGDDHLWGHGSVGRDIRNSTYRVCRFSPC